MSFLDNSSTSLAATSLATTPFSEGDTTSLAKSQARPGDRLPIPLRPQKGHTPPPATKESDFQKGRKTWDRASAAVFQISNNVASLDSLVKLLGSPKDTQDLRSRLASAQNDLDEESTSENAPLMQHHQLETALDMEIEYNESLIQEREQDLQNIERSIVEVNEIFRDLGTIVGEQQFMLDHIESNVGNVAVHVEGATNELRVAAERQKRSQQWMCCMYTVLGAVGLVVVLVILR
ncbi:hypothetical protein HDU98_001134 [Podochytrium sp. JEL0797]|nr:hypothetical protein HDU98_001134 [Podochytrium sp. JEL0797]